MRELLMRYLALVLCGMLLLSCAKPQVSEASKNVENKNESRAGSSDRGDGNGSIVFEENFEASDWREHWQGSEKQWTVENGRLKGQGDRNKGLWWKGDLPQEVRIEFDAWAESADGDLKVELLGSKREHQSGYVAILGGWKNRISIIARLDEHGADRIENRSKVATPGKKHEWVLERVNGTLSFTVDEEQVARFEDDAPLAGTSFGFANWEAPVAFDNLRIIDLMRKGSENKGKALTPVSPCG